MRKRPISNRFRESVIDGRKTTTIRDKAWPVGIPIMLYSWEGLPYRSKQSDLHPVKVLGFWPIRIIHHSFGFMLYECGKEGEPLWQSEGFTGQEEMDDWFRHLVKPGQAVEKYLMKFTLISAK